MTLTVNGDPRDLPPLEVLEHMAVVDQLDGAVLKEGEVVDARHVIDVRVVDHIDVHVPGNVATTAPEVELHGDSPGE